MTSRSSACYQIVKKPVITEKATDDSAARNATRSASRWTRTRSRSGAPRGLFEVRVMNVNTMHVKAGGVRGRSIGQTQSWKKALVVLAEGQTIEIL